MLHLEEDLLLTNVILNLVHLDELILSDLFDGVLLLLIFFASNFRPENATESAFANWILVDLKVF